MANVHDYFTGVGKVLDGQDVPGAKDTAVRDSGRVSVNSNEKTVADYVDDFRKSVDGYADTKRGSLSGNDEDMVKASYEKLMSHSDGIDANQLGNVISASAKALNLGLELNNDSDLDGRIKASVSNIAKVQESVGSYVAGGDQKADMESAIRNVGHDVQENHDVLVKDAARTAVSNVVKDVVADGVAYSNATAASYNAGISEVTHLQGMVDSHARDNRVGNVLAHTANTIGIETVADASAGMDKESRDYTFSQLMRATDPALRVDVDMEVLRQMDSENKRLGNACPEVVRAAYDEAALNLKAMGDTIQDYQSRYESAGAVLKNFAMEYGLDGPNAAASHDMSVPERGNATSRYDDVLNEADSVIGPSGSSGYGLGD